MKPTRIAKLRDQLRTVKKACSRIFDGLSLPRDDLHSELTGVVKDLAAAQITAKPLADWALRAVERESLRERLLLWRKQSDAVWHEIDAHVATWRAVECRSDDWEYRREFQAVLGAIERYSALILEEIIPILAQLETLNKDATVNSFIWTEELSVENETVDHQHKQLLDTFNDLLYASSRLDRERYDITMAELVTLAEFHTQTELQYLQDLHCPDIDAHKRLHEELLERLHALPTGEELSEDNCADPGRVLRDFVKHMQEADQIMRVLAPMQWEDGKDTW